MAFRGQDLVEGLMSRETGRRGGRGSSALLHQRDLLGNISFEATATTVPLPPSSETTGLPLCARYNRNPSFSSCHLLAIGGEEGFVTIANTEDLQSLQRGVADGSWRFRAHWPCHRNSIFDLAWAKNDSVMYTASGHQQVGVWDTNTARGLAVAEGHEGSVKSVSPLHLCEDVFATGARDGRIMLWDARCPGFSSHAAPGLAGGPRRTHVAPGTTLDGAAVLSPVWVQEAAHTRPPAPGAGRASSKAAKAPPTTVTSVAFVPYSYLLASGGAQDTVVKLWDLRMRGLPLCDLELPRAPAGAGRAGGAKGKAGADAGLGGVPHEVASYACPARAAASGVTHITFSDAGDRLLVSCLDSQHHLFSLARLASGPIATWSAPTPAFKGSFYMRSTFSPCGDYVLSGSRDCGAHIWSTADPQRPPISLPHEHEVTGVAWCGGEWGQVATCSDSGEVRVWTLSRLAAREAAATTAAGAGILEVTAMLAAAPQQVLEARAAAQPSTLVEVVAAAAAAVVAAVQEPVAAAALPMTPATGLAARPTTARRLVQSRLNLERAPRVVATPVPARPAGATTAAAVAEADDLSPSPVRAGAATPLPLPAAAALTVPFFAANGVAGAAEAMRASALRSPVSTAAPAQPAASAGAARRTGPVPPVPVFSPAVNRWQQRGQQQRPVECQVAHSRASPAAAVPLPCSAAIGAVSSLEAAMLGLPQVRTQSPARIAAEQRAAAATALASSSQSVHIADEHREQQTAQAARPLPATGATVVTIQLPVHAGTAARLPAISPHATLSAFHRSRSRLGPFSPCRSSQSSGSGGSASLTQSSGGTPRPTASGHHQPPQGIVTQLLRASPRPTAFASPDGGHAAASDALFSPTSPSPRSRSRHSQPDAFLGGAGSGSVVGRQLFGAPAPEGLPPPPPPQSPRMQADAGHHHWHLPSPGFTGHTQYTGTVAGSPVAAGSRLQAPAGSPLRSPRMATGPIGSPMRSPRAASGPSGSPMRSPRVYDIQDGADVGPALLHRALHPEDSGPFDEGILAAAADSLSEDGGSEDDGARSDDGGNGLGHRQQRRRASDSEDEDGAAWGGPRRGRQGSPPPRAAPVPLLHWGEAAEVAEEREYDLSRLGELALGRLAGGSDATVTGAGVEGSWALRGFGSGQGCEMVLGGGGVLGFPGFSDSDDDDSDSDFETDPYGDKENTPPPEELEGSVAGLPTSSAATASVGPSASPRRVTPAAAVPLPLPSHLASGAEAASPPSPARRSQPRHEDGAPPAAAPPPHMTSPFASAPPFAVVVEAMRAAGDGAMPAAAPSLHSVPTFGRECCLAMAGRYHSRASSDGGGDGDGEDLVDGMDMDGPAGQLAADSPPPSQVLQRGRRSHPGNGDAACDDGCGAGGAGGLVLRFSDNPTPTKRARRSYGGEGDADAPGSGGASPDDASRAGARYRSPSPPPRTNLADPVAAEDSLGLGAMPTPRGKLRPPGGCGFGCAAAAAGPGFGAAAGLGFGFGVTAGMSSAAAMPPPPSPCVRGSVGSRGAGAGGSRLRGAAAAPMLAAAAAIFAAAGNAEAGSESPAPKVGTASRTGSHTNAAAREFHRRRMEEEQEQRGGAVMSPFGFGLLSPSPLLQQQPHSAAHHGAGCSGEAASVSAGGQHDQAVSRFRLQEGGGRGGARGGQRLVAQVGHLLGDERAHSHPQDESDEEEGEEEGRTLLASVKSLSVIFETQTQGTQVVPCTYPVEEEEGEEARGFGFGGQGRGGLFGAGRGLSFLYHEEERTAASPEHFGMRRVAGADNGGDDDSGFELRSRGGAAALERCDSVNFSKLFGRTQHRQQSQAQQQPLAPPPPLPALPLPTLPLDESSRCFPPATGGGGFGAATPGGSSAVAAPPPAAASFAGHIWGLDGGAAAAALTSPARVLPPAAATPSRAQQQAVPDTFPRLAGEALPPSAPAGVSPRAHGAAAAAVRSFAVPAQPPAAGGVQARKPKQQTLRQCWAATPQAAAAPQQDPMQEQPGLGFALGLGDAAPSRSVPRALGPTGLTSPRYFR